MKVFLTGANGFIGLPTIRALVVRGYHVIGLTRSDVGAKKIIATYPNFGKDITILRDSSDNYDLISETAAQSDGVIHLAYNHKFTETDRMTAAKQDNAVLDALFAGLQQDGTEMPLIVASGCAGLRPGSLLKAGHAKLGPL